MSNDGGAGRGNGGRINNNSERGRQNRYFRNRRPPAPGKKLDSNEEVPMLRFGSNNNYTIFREKLSTACIEKFGNLGRLIETGEYWQPPEIKEDKYKSDDENK